MAAYFSFNKFNWKSVSQAFWPNLAIAIIYRACLDYEDRLVALYFETDPIKSRDKYGDFREVKDFFGSDWWYTLTNIDHKKVMRKLNQQVKNRIEHKQIRKKYQTLWGTFGEEKEVIFSD